MITITALNHVLIVTKIETNMKIRSSFLSNFFHGSHILDCLVPWSIIIDPLAKTLIIRKRNYYLIGIDKTIVPIRNIRRVLVDEHFFGADVELKIFGTGSVKARCLKKRDVKKLQQYCLDSMNSLSNQKL